MMLYLLVPKKSKNTNSLCSVVAAPRPATLRARLHSMAYANSYVNKNWNDNRKTNENWSKKKDDPEYKNKAHDWWPSLGDGKTTIEPDDTSKDWTYVDPKNYKVANEVPKQKGEWQSHPEAWGSTPQNIPDTPVPYVGPPSPNCAPSDAQMSDKQFAQIAQRAFEEVNANMWETFAQASTAASPNDTSAKPDPQTDVLTKAKDKAADSSYRIAAATNALVTDADWKGEKWGVEHSQATFDESSDEEARRMGKAFVASCSR